MWLSHLAVCSADYKYCSQKQLCFSFLFFVCYFLFVFSSVWEICVCLRLNCMVHVVITIYRLLFLTKIGVCVLDGGWFLLFSFVSKFFSFSFYIFIFLLFLIYISFFLFLSMTTRIILQTEQKWNEAFIHRLIIFGRFASTPGRWPDRGRVGKGRGCRRNLLKRWPDNPTMTSPT